MKLEELTEATDADKGVLDILKAASAPLSIKDIIEKSDNRYHSEHVMAIVNRLRKSGDIKEEFGKTGTHVYSLA